MKRLLALCVVTLSAMSCLPRCGQEGGPVALHVVPKTFFVQRVEWHLRHRCSRAGSGDTEQTNCTIKQGVGEERETSPSCTQANLVLMATTETEQQIGAMINRPFRGELCVSGDVLMKAGQNVHLPERLFNIDSDKAIDVLYEITGPAGVLVAEPPKAGTPGC